MRSKRAVFPRSFLPAFVLCAFALWPVAPNLWADSESLDFLHKVTRQLAEMGKGLAIYRFLEMECPKFARQAASGGLADYLDGRLSFEEFKRNWERIAFSDPGASEMNKYFEQFERAVGNKKFNVPNPAFSVKRYIEGEVTTSETVSELWRELYQGEEHPLKPIWGEKMKTVEVVPVGDASLTWLSPTLFMPEVGIKPGIFRTAEQQKAVLDLLGVMTLVERQDYEHHPRRGTAAFPWWSGRAINPNPKVLMVIDSLRGEVVPQLISKGVGKTRPDVTRDGKIDMSECAMDAGLSQSLSEAGARLFRPIAVIGRESEPGKAIYVRGAISTMRLYDLFELGREKNIGKIDTFGAYGGWYPDHTSVDNPEPLMRSLAMYLDDLSIIEGKRFSVKEWAEDWLSRTTGKNAGIFDELGIKRGRPVFETDNHGLGEAVDWGRVELGWKRDGRHIDPEKEVYWRYIAKVMERLNAVLPGGERIDLDRAKQNFESGYEEGRIELQRKNSRLALDRDLAKLMETNDLRRLAAGLNPLRGLRTEYYLDLLEREGLVTQKRLENDKSGPGILDRLDTVSNLAAQTAEGKARPRARK